MFFRFIGLLALLGLWGCSSSGSDAICRPFGNTGEVRTLSAGTQLEDSERAYDTDLSSAAQLYSLSGIGEAELGLRGSATSAAFAGVLLTLPAGQTTQVAVDALRDGEVVSSGVAGFESGVSQVCSGICVNSGNQTYYGAATPEAFDEIRVNLQFTGTTEDTLIYELCLR